MKFVSGARVLVDVTRKGGIMDVCGREKGHVRWCTIIGKFPLLPWGVNGRFPSPTQKKVIFPVHVGMELILTCLPDDMVHLTGFLGGDFQQMKLQ
jgi:hypothetical protein